MAVLFQVGTVFGGIFMGQESGHIQGSDGKVLSGSGGFSVEKTGPGQYDLTFSGNYGTNIPAVLVTPLSRYTTARATVNPNENWLGFVVLTGYTDQGSTNYLDCDFSFEALWMGK